MSEDIDKIVGVNTALLGALNKYMAENNLEMHHTTTGVHLFVNNFFITFIQQFKEEQRLEMLQVCFNQTARELATYAGLKVKISVEAEH